MLLVHGVANPVLLIGAADTNLRYGCLDRSDGKLFGANDV